jgi:hypothetical protein
MMEEKHNMNALKEGLELTSIHFDDVVNKCPYIVGKNCKRITVSMECGQMSGVPWAIVDETTMVNLSLVDMVEIKEGA